jgi:hypothetical protein
MYEEKYILSTHCDSQDKTIVVHYSSWRIFITEHLGGFLASIGLNMSEEQ